MLNRALIRVDASLTLGIGHAMRCLVIANALASRGVECQFLMRSPHPSVEKLLIQHGVGVSYIASDDASSISDWQLARPHENRSQLEWASDARRSKEALDVYRPDLLVVDHYFLDHRWESTVRARSMKLMVVDDLANRSHDCDLVLDCNLGRKADHYNNLVPHDCRILAGPTYALLRPEFAEWRAFSLNRRINPVVERILVSMGGVDSEDVTSSVLTTLRSCAVPNDCRITVLMGSAAPHLERVRSLAAKMTQPTEVLVGAANVAEIMANCDLAIGAAGGTAWERCCLGLPTLLVLQAENQRAGAEALHAAGANCLLGQTPSIAATLPPMVERIVSFPRLLVAMSSTAASIVDGKGSERLVDELERLHE